MSKEKLERSAALLRTLGGEVILDAAARGDSHKIRNKKVRGDFMFSGPRDSAPMQCEPIHLKL
jgi:hypothetical protein